MEDIGLHPKPSNDPPVHRPPVPTETFGLHHVQPDHVQVADGSRKCDSEKDGVSRIRVHSVIAGPQMIPQGLSQIPAALVTDSTLLNPAVKHENTDLENEVTARKQPNAKVGDPSKWKQNEQKQLRMEGKAYVSKRKKGGEAVTKQPRSMGPRCTSNACKKASNRFCNDIAEDARVKMFDGFWHQMNWAQRKLYVAGLVDRDPVERPRPVVRSQSRRSVSLRYHLWADGERKQVCKNMFLSTLGIGEWCVLNWAQKGTAKKSKSSEIKLEKRQTVPKCPEQSPAPSTDGNTVDLTEGEQVNTPDKDKSAQSEAGGPARKKSKVAKPLTWKQNRQKQLRMEGKSYISYRKKDGVTITKAQRAMGPGCTSGACKRASNRFCAEISDETREELFSGFWQRMNWSQRKLYVARLVDCDPVERTRAPWTQSRRAVSMRYHLIADGDRKQVCKRMFLSTLGIGEWSVLNWAQNAAAPPDDSEDKRLPRKSRKASEHLFLKEFLESLPKVPSYCCGASITKMFLEPAFSNMSEVYRRYHSHCSEKKTTPLSRQVFCAVFKKMDLGLCDPKKDQGFSYGATGNLFNELWEEYCMERGAPGPQHKDVCEGSSQ